MKGERKITTTTTMLYNLVIVPGCHLATRNIRYEVTVLFPHTTTPEIIFSFPPLELRLFV